MLLYDLSCFVFVGLAGKILMAIKDNGFHIHALQIVWSSLISFFVIEFFLITFKLRIPCYFSSRGNRSVPKKVEQLISLLEPMPCTTVIRLYLYPVHTKILTSRTYNATFGKSAI